MSRSLQMKRHVIWSFVIKVVLVLVNLLFVPLTIHYINPERYGIWLTLTSVISWFNLLDIGFGNGLRNKFAEATANDDKETQRKLIHTTFFAVTIISLIIFIIYFLSVQFFSWDKLLGVSPRYKSELSKLMFYIVGLFCIQFILQIYNSIQLALQNPSVVSLASLIGSIFGLIGIIILRLFFSPSLIALGLVIMGSNVFALFLFCLHYFGIKRRDFLKNIYLPSYGDIKSMFSLGVKFFVLNIAYVIQYQTSNFLISRYLSAEKVTEFNIAFKLFSVETIIFGIIIAPVWSSVTDAKAKNDYSWIRKTVKKLLLFWSAICIGCLIVVFLSPFIYQLWIGKEIQIPIMTSFAVASVVCINSFSAIFIYVLNGLSKVGIQFYLSILIIVIFIPIAYYFAVTLQLGIVGICIAIIVTSVNGFIVAPVQVYKELKHSKLES